VTGGGDGGQGVTPFIEIPTNRTELVGEQESTTVNTNATTSNPTSSIQSRLNPVMER
jgi:hypothetical protein